ncbi:Fe-S oxidoreductase [Leptolyngbya sp. PCC 7375]|nr:Fe-S oxidoreductase [Leptolyngbya sp. PCC 7375]
MTRHSKILLLDLYELSASRPYIQPYLYLGAFFDYLQIEYEIFRWHNNAEELLTFIEKKKIEFVLINLIMGPVLSLVEPVCGFLKTIRPELKIWVGGIAVYFIRELLESCPYIDRVSTGHPRYDSKAYAKELFEHGILSNFPNNEIIFPTLITNKNLKYFIHQHQGINRPNVNTIEMSTSSGCLHRCSFCYLSRVPAWQQTIDELLNDLESLTEQYNIQYFEFSDDNFPENIERLRAFSSRVVQSNLNISYFCLGSIDNLNSETLDLMTRSGLKRLFIGVDAIHPQQLRQLNKNYTQKELFAVIDLVRSYPIDLCLSLVLGSAQETIEKIQDLHDWVKSIHPEVCYVQFLTPYPNTPAYYQALRLGFQPPKSLKSWAEIADFEKPKPFLNLKISEEEYLKWRARFRELSTRQYRTDIGENLRRL